MPYIIDDPSNKRFMLNRETLISPAVLAQEQDKIFAKCWIYVGHSSELKNPGDFITRKVAGHPIIFSKDDQQQIHCLLNTCRHRGAVVATKPAGNARRFFCIYHGWSYKIDGSINRIPGSDAYDPSFPQEEHGLRRPPRFESYRDFWFLCFDPDAMPLADYLADAKFYIDLILDQSPSGTMEIIPGTQEYSVSANWKLMVENSVDDYHLPTTHSTWLNFMSNSGVNVHNPNKEAGQLLPTKGYAKALGNGNFTTDNINFRGRPVAHWIPLYGDEAKTEIESMYEELVERLGPERAERVANTNRNLVIFPDLVINDGSSVTIRTFAPNGPDKMDVTAWALGPVEETTSARARRLDAFLTFYGPGGFATPDDVEALELVQQGMANWRHDPWSEMSRGMNKPEDQQLNSDEHHLRIFWRHWNSLMQDEK